MRVDVRAYLKWHDPETGVNLPALHVRAAPGQCDDVFVSTPELDVLAWSPHPACFSIASCGIALTCRNVLREPGQREVGILHISVDVGPDPHECRLVKAERDGRAKRCLKSVSPSCTLAEVCVSIPKGPVCASSAAQNQHIKIDTDRQVVTACGCALAWDSAVDPDALGVACLLVDLFCIYFRPRTGCK